MENNREDISLLLEDIKKEISTQTDTLLGSFTTNSDKLDGINDTLKSIYAIDQERIRDEQRRELLTVKEKKSKESRSIRGGISRGLESGIGSILRGVGSGVGLLSRFVGVGAGLASLGVGLGGFFTGIAAADYAIENLGNGEHIAELMSNISVGISHLDGDAIATLGSTLAAGGLLGAAIGPARSLRMATGMTALGLGIGGFMTGMVAAGDITGFDGSTFAAQAANIASGLNDFGNLSTNAQSAIAVLATSGALMGSISNPATQLRVATGMGAVGLGIGAFMTGMVAAGDITGFDGSTFAAQAANIASGLSEFENLNSYTMAGLTTLAGLGALAGASGGSGVLSAAFAASGMGIAGFGIGAFMAGISAAGDITGFDGSTFAAQARNIAEGLSAFSNGQLAGLTALMATGAILGPTGSAIAATGMGLIGMGIGAFITGIAGIGDLAAWAGVDGSGINTMLTNIAGGLSAFTGIDGSNFSQIGEGMVGLGAGLLAFVAGEGLGGITESIRDTFNSVWAWFTGQEYEDTNRFERIANDLQVFNGLDYSGIRELGNANLGNSLTSFATALAAFPDSGDIPIDAIDRLFNLIDEGIGMASDEEDYQNFNRFASSLNTFTSALSRLSGLDLSNISNFDFGAFGRQVALGAEALDVAMNGGTIRSGRNVTVANGLATQQASIEDTISNLRILQTGIDSIYSSRTDAIGAAAVNQSPAFGQPVVINGPSNTDASVTNTTNTTILNTTDPSRIIDPSIIISP